MSRAPASAAAPSFLLLTADSEGIRERSEPSGNDNCCGEERGEGGARELSCASARGDAGRGARAAPTHPLLVVALPNNARLASSARDWGHCPTAARGGARERVRERSKGARGAGADEAAHERAALATHTPPSQNVCFAEGAGERGDGSDARRGVVRPGERGDSERANVVSRLGQRVCAPVLHPSPPTSVSRTPPLPRGNRILQWQMRPWGRTRRLG